MKKRKNQNTFISILLSMGTLLALIAMLSYAALYPKAASEEEYSQYVVVFPPNTKHTDAFKHIIKAGGTPVRSGNYDYLLVAATNNPNFQKSVKKNGALFLFSPIISGGCFIENKARFKKSQGMPS